LEQHEQVVEWGDIHSDIKTAWISMSSVRIPMWAQTQHSKAVGAVPAWLTKKQAYPSLRGLPNLLLAVATQSFVQHALTLTIEQLQCLNKAHMVFGHGAVLCSKLTWGCNCLS
jgi:hypothetical protein